MPITRKQRLNEAAKAWLEKPPVPSGQSFIDGLEAAARWHDDQAIKAEGFLAKADSKTEVGRTKLQNLSAMASQHRMYAAQIRLLKRDAQNERLRLLGFRAEPS